ncbi:Myb domain protein 62 [Tanacetum coccineum]|uniref:Myb domain protein 62 n=1 Tax=Tanacetum coccineum TaxID=301880 RepID=A0ABQ5H5K8_9ASTR
MSLREISAMKDYIELLGDSVYELKQSLDEMTLQEKVPLNKLRSEEAAGSGTPAEICFKLLKRVLGHLRGRSAPKKEILAVENLRAIVESKKNKSAALEEKLKEDMPYFMDSDVLYCVSRALEGRSKTQSYVGLRNHTHRVSIRIPALIPFGCYCFYSPGLHAFGLQFVNRPGSKDSGLVMSDIQTWVSSAMTDEETCFEGFADDPKMKGVTTTIALFPGDMSGLSPATCRWGNLSPATCRWGILAGEAS